MVVQQDGSQCRHIHFVFVFVGNVRSQCRIQCMDTFNNQYHVFFYPEFLTAHFSFSGSKVIAWQFHLSSVEQGSQLFFEEGEVYGIQGFEVVFAVLVQRGIVPVDEIVIQ